MIKVNPNFSKLMGSYLFSEIAKRESAFIAAHPDAQVIKLGIGDVTMPLAPAVVDAMQKAAAELGRAESFRGYGPYEGYAFLREAIVANDYAARGMDIAADEIFVSDGAKSDTGSFQELFSTDCTVAVTDPVYPVYVDTNVMAGRTGAYDDSAMGYAGIVYLPTTAENGFVPEIPAGKVDLVYLCSPNNPTGTVLRKPELQQWVDWANKTGAVILMDSAYESFITEDDVPHSIFEIEGAKTCAVEFRSFSKSAGFTGTRCAYTVVPKELMGVDASGAAVSLNDMWMRRQSTKFNGVSYVIQRGAEAVYSKDGKAQNAEIIAGYLSNAKIIKAGLEDIGLEVYGGVNSPYVWLKTPGNMKSWDFFDKLLAEANVVGTPGSGFGSKGEHYFRLTAFNTEENTKKAIERIKQLKF
mgnify:CR=1 FL=1